MTSWQEDSSVAQSPIMNHTEQHVPWNPGYWHPYTVYLSSLRLILIPILYSTHSSVNPLGLQTNSLCFLRTCYSIMFLEILCQVDRLEDDRVQVQHYVCLCESYFHHHGGAIWKSFKPWSQYCKTWLLWNIGVEGMWLMIKIFNIHELVINEWLSCGW